MFSRKILIAVIGLMGLIGLIGQANAFIGPGTNQPGEGGGLFRVDANRNIGFGTDSGTPSSVFDAPATSEGPTSHGYVFTVASTTNPGISLKNVGGGASYV